MTAGLHFKQPVDSHVAKLLVRNNEPCPSAAAGKGGHGRRHLVREGTGAISQLIEAGFLLTR